MPAGGCGAGYAHEIAADIARRYSRANDSRTFSSDVQNVGSIVTSISKNLEWLRALSVIVRSVATQPRPAVRKFLTVTITSPRLGDTLSNASRLSSAITMRVNYGLLRV